MFPVLIPKNPCENSSWSEWPEESFDDPKCKCDYLENHSFCPIHGLRYSIERYQKDRPDLFKWEVE